MRRIQDKDLRELCDWAQPDDPGAFVEAIAAALDEYHLFGNTQEWRQARERLENYIAALEDAARRLNELEGTAPSGLRVDRRRIHWQRVQRSLDKDRDQQLRLGEIPDRGPEANDVQLGFTDDVVQERATLRMMIQSNREALERLEVRKGSHAERRNQWLVPAILNALLYYSEEARSWSIEQLAEFVRETLMRAGVQFPAVHSSEGDRGKGYRAVARALKSLPSPHEPCLRVRSYTGGVGFL